MYNLHPLLFSHISDVLNAFLQCHSSAFIYFPCPFRTYELRFHCTDFRVHCIYFMYWSFGYVVYSFPHFPDPPHRYKFFQLGLLKFYSVVLYFI